MTTPLMEGKATSFPGGYRYMTVHSAERRWIEKARVNPGYFIEYLTEKKPAQHHVDWMYNILDPTCKRLLIIAPRESAKTTIAVYMLTWFIGKFPWLTNFIGSVAHAQAIERIGMIKEVIEYNPRFKNVFPNIFMDYTKPYTVDQFTVWSDKWADNPATIDHKLYRSLISRYGEPKNPTMFGAGITSSKIIGKRFSGIALVDDPHSAANSTTEEQRDKIEQNFEQYVLGGSQHTAKVVVITTRWAETDLAGRMIEKKSKSGKKIWRVFETSALREDEDTGELISYWPEYWPVPKLLEKKDEVEQAMWETMYMNNPLGLAGGEFTIDQLRVDLPDVLPEFDKVILSIDLAASDKDYSDYTVIAAVGRDKARPYAYYVLGMVRGKFLFKQAISEIIKFSDEVFELYGKLDGLLFEKQGFQSIWADEVKSLRPDLPVKLVPVRGDKAERLKAVAIKAQGKRLFINQKISCIHALQSELLGFPRAQHDDIPDALSLPFQFWGVIEAAAGTVLVKSEFLT